MSRKIRAIINFRVSHVVILFFMALPFNSCNKDDNGVTDQFGEVLYSDGFCSPIEVHWLPCNNEILSIDDCGRLYRINVETKSKILLKNFYTDYNHLYQKGFYSEELPEKLIYVALVIDPLSGSYDFFKIFVFDLEEKESELLIDESFDLDFSLQVQLLMGHLNLAILHQEELIIIDIVTKEKKYLPISDRPVAFSPDDDKILLYQVDHTLVFGAYIYDFSCNCQYPFDMQVYGQPFWREEGMFGFYYHSNGVAYYNLATGELFSWFDSFPMGHNIANHGTLLITMIRNQNIQNPKVDFISIDFTSGEQRIIKTIDYNPILSQLYGLSISNDQKKLTYIHNYPGQNEIRLIPIE